MYLILLAQFCPSLRIYLSKMKDTETILFRVYGPLLHLRKEGLEGLFVLENRIGVIQYIRF